MMTMTMMTTMMTTMNITTSITMKMKSMSIITTMTNMMMTSMITTKTIITTIIITTMTMKKAKPKSTASVHSCTTAGSRSTLPSSTNLWQENGHAM